MQLVHVSDVGACQCGWYMSVPLVLTLEEVTLVHVSDVGTCSDVEPFKWNRTIGD